MHVSNLHALCVQPAKEIAILTLDSFCVVKCGVFSYYLCGFSQPLIQSAKFVDQWSRETFFPPMCAAATQNHLCRITVGNSTRLGCMLECTISDSLEWVVRFMLR